MVKKINNLKTRKKHNKDKRTAALILLSEGKSQIWVANNLSVTKQRVSYWANHPIAPRKRKAKLDDAKIDKIVKNEGNKPTSEIGSRAIANIINKELKEENIFDKKGRNLTITKSTINNYLKKRGLKPRKIKKIFIVTEKQKKQRVDFCKKY